MSTIKHLSKREFNEVKSSWLVYDKARQEADKRLIKDNARTGFYCRCGEEIVSGVCENCGAENAPF